MRSMLKATAQYVVDTLERSMVLCNWILALMVLYGAGKGMHWLFDKAGRAIEILCGG